MQVLSENPTLMQNQKIRRTKILCSLGPTCDDEGTLEKLMLAGIEGARINFSHGTLEEHLVRIKRFRKVEEKMGKKLPLIMDTKGPEIRTGKFEKEFDLPDGVEYALTIKEQLGNEKVSYVNHEGLPKDVKEGDTILVNDGLIELKVTKITETDVITKVIHGGHMSDTRGVNLPNIKSSLPPVTDKDLKDLKFGAENGIDIILVSFTRNADVIRKIRSHVESCGRKDMEIIAKIENQEGLDNINEIMDVADGILVARGDLGVEIPVERVPIIQKKIFHKCILKGKVSILATHMLDSMIVNPRPTRAEVTDVANAVIDGASCLLLTGETANGKFPVESINYLDKIIRETERNADFSKLSVDFDNFKGINAKNENNFRDCINFSVAVTALTIKAEGIVAITTGGKTPKTLSKFRPPCPIFCITNKEIIARQLAIEWGIQTIYVNEDLPYIKLVNTCIEKFKELGFLEKGQQIVVSGGASVIEKEYDEQITGGIKTIK